jgi:hypothetical protein
MAMKKKKADKSLRSDFKGKNRAPKRVINAISPSEESSRPVLAYIGSSIGTMLGRTRAFFQPAEEADA